MVMEKTLECKGLIRYTSCGMFHHCIQVLFLYEKNPAYGRQRIFQPMRIVEPIS